MHYMNRAALTSQQVVEACACTRLHTAARLLTRAYDEALRAAGVNASQLAILAAVDVDDATSIAALSKYSGLTWFYYVTRDTHDPAIGLRARGMYPVGEDPATGSAAGCTAAWMVRYGLANSDQAVHIEQGLEIKRPSHIFVKAACESEKVLNVRVGGNAVGIAEGKYSL
jgi:PhzF family phenazine biosynthesis protein